jgi:hypothetical protein
MYYFLPSTQSGQPLKNKKYEKIALVIIKYLLFPNNFYYIL